MEDSIELQQMRQADKMLRRLMQIQEKLDDNQLCYDGDAAAILTDEQKTGILASLLLEKEQIVGGLVQMMTIYQQQLGSK